MHPVDPARVERLRPSRFDAFYAASWLDVYRPLAATLSDRDLAAEAVDEAMVRAYASWSRVRDMANPEGWVYRVALRWAIDQVRRRRVETRLMGKMAVRDQAEGPMVEPALGRALAMLPIDQRAVVVLSSVFGWTHSEIAEALGVRVGTVKSRMHRGIARMREELGCE